VLTAPKNPAKQRGGIAAARVRWANHPTRVVRLDALTPDQRRLVLALVDAAKDQNAKKAATEVAPVTASEVRHGTADPAR
jgi:hypothetical protein